jgi:hypothetical protein
MTAKTNQTFKHEITSKNKASKLTALKSQLLLSLNKSTLIPLNNHHPAFLAFEENSSKEALAEQLEAENKRESGRTYANVMPPR